MVKWRNVMSGKYRYSVRAGQFKAIGQVRSGHGHADNHRSLISFHTRRVLIMDSPIIYGPIALESETHSFSKSLPIPSR